MSTGTPKRRFAIGFKNDSWYLFVVVPETPPKVKEEPPPLMFFASAPANPPLPPPLPPSADCYDPAPEWAGGSTVIPLCVTGNGDLQRCSELPELHVSSLTDVRETYGPFDTFKEFPAVFGCLLIDKMYFLVAEQVEKVAELPNNGSIFKVERTTWIAVPLPGVLPPQLSATDRARQKEFQEYNYHSGYYYSDDVDLRAPFPFCSGKRDDAPNFECDWSENIRLPFCAISKQAVCSMLVRGFARGTTVPRQDGTRVHLLLLGRQNRLNPGPRYHGRGLNLVGAAGNDHLYEYILWTVHRDGSVAFAKHTILRGTIPVNWSTQLSVSISEPAMVFSSNPEDVYHGTNTYFRRTYQMLERLIQHDAGRSVARPAKLRCVNMLRLAPQGGEAVLAKHFVEAVRRVQSAPINPFPKGSLELVHVDWLNTVRDYGIETAVSTMWQAAVGLFAQHTDAENGMVTSGLIDREGRIHRRCVQTHFLRINCADSLDRTNLGCFCTCVQASLVMLEMMGCSCDSFTVSPKLPSIDTNEVVGLDTGYAAAFMPVSGANNTIPSPFLATWSDAIDPSRIPSSIIRSLAELFVYNGDCIAMLYTNSVAMHGNILRGICGMRPTGSNAVIATQRRYENAFEDRKKFRCIELLLGRDRDVHFPSLSEVFLTRPIPYRQWSCAAVLLGVPIGTTFMDIDTELRRMWNADIFPHLVEVPIESSALCVDITLQPEEEENHHNYEAVVRQLSFATSPPSSYTTEDGELTTPQRQRIAVLQFDDLLCSALDVITLLRRKGFLSLKGHNTIIAAYAYPVDHGAEVSGVGETVRSVGTSLMRGFKHFVRNLN